MADEQPTREDLQAVAALLPALLRVEAHPAEWRGGEPSSDGTLQMPYAEYAPEVRSLLSAVYDCHLIVAFDWGAWQDDARRFLDPEVIARASLDDVRRLLTLHVRKERLCEGHLAEMITSGHVAAVLRRLGELGGA
jgi:Family of unknown function (DUF6508)